jgi:thymidylate kinase
MPSSFFIIAGPQCAGKTTTKSYLYSRYMAIARSQTPGATPEHRNLFLLPEMRQLVMHERGIHSAIFIDIDTERKIVERDLARMDDIIEKADDRIYLDETNIYTLAHARRRGLHVNDLVSEYGHRLQTLNAAILFLDVPPDISWQRRKVRYQERVNGFPQTEAAKVMEMYRDYLVTLHQELMNVSNMLKIELRRIDATGSVEATLSAAAIEFEQLTGARSVALVRRF